MPLLSQLSVNGNYTIAGTFDEATFNRNSGYKKNLFPYSQLFSNPNGWSTTGLLSPVLLGIAPDGTNTATLINEDTSVNNSHWYTNYANITITPYGRYTFSCYFRPVSGDRNFFIQLYDGVGYAQIQSNATGGIFSAASASGYYSNASGTIVAVGNGWFRASVTATLGPLNYVNVRIAMFNNGAQYYSGNGKSCMYIWGAQIEAGTSATIYEVTDASGLSSSNTASRLDTSGNFYTGGIIDEATYNTTSSYKRNLLYSTNLGITNVWSTTGAAVITNAIIAPDGTLTGTLLNETATTAGHEIGNFFNFGPIAINLNQPLTFSVYVKAKERSRIQLGPQAWTTYFRNSASIFDLNKQTASLSYNSNGALVGGQTITPVGDGWYRCSMNVVLGGTDNSVALHINIMDDSGTNVTTYLGDPTKGIYLWGPQIEQGTTATVYTPTNLGVVVPPFKGSRLDTSGNLYLSGTYDEVTRNPNSGYIKNFLSYSGSISNPTFWDIRNSVLSTTDLAPDNSFTAIRYGYKIPYALIQQGSTTPSNPLKLVYGQIYTVSVYAKVDKIARYVAIVTSSGFANYDLNFINTSSGGGVLNASITLSTNDFYRLSMTIKCAVTTGLDTVGFWLGGYNGQDWSGQNMTLWGPQIELGTQATDYVPTGLNGIPLN